jgi:hypothetical protein
MGRRLCRPPFPHSSIPPRPGPPLPDFPIAPRCLAGFEADPNRAAAMHRCRAQLLEPLSGALNPDHYPGLSRSIDLEVAHIFREISDIRELQPGQAAKVRLYGAGGGVVYRNTMMRAARACDRPAPSASEWVRK